MLLVSQQLLFEDIYIVAANDIHRIVMSQQMAILYIGCCARMLYGILVIIPMAACTRYSIWLGSVEYLSLHIPV